MRRPSRLDSPTLTGPSFLDEVLEAILAHPCCEAQQLHRLAVVLPSHRAMGRIRRALQAKLTPPARLPRFYALSGFVEDSSPWAAADPLEVLARFYHLVHDAQPELTFDRFVPWATVVLGDFAAVDHELNTHAVFQNLPTSKGSNIGALGGDVVRRPKAFERHRRRLPPCTSN